MPGRCWTLALQPSRSARNHLLWLIGPMSAGLDVQATIGVKALSLTPWQGLGVVSLWTVGALLLGALGLKFRDA
jgi:hypothetical protein